MAQHLAPRQELMTQLCIKPPMLVCLVTQATPQGHLLPQPLSIPVEDIHTPMVPLAEIFAIKVCQDCRVRKFWMHSEGKRIRQTFCFMVVAFIIALDNYWFIWKEELKNIFWEFLTKKEHTFYLNEYMYFLIRAVTLLKESIKKKNWKSLYENSILGPSSFLSIISACIYTRKKDRRRLYFLRFNY